MIWNEYIVESSRTLLEKDAEFNLRHFKMGLATERGELLDIFKRYYIYGKPLDIIHVKEELGDILWYDANRFRLFGRYPTKLKKINELINLIDYWLELDVNKYSLWNPVLYTCNLLDLDICDVMETNISKLKGRFPDKFDSFLALNRDLDNERQILEK